MKIRRKILGLFVVAFLVLTIIVAVVLQNKKIGIFFRSDNSLECLQNIIEESVERMRKQWNMSEDSVIINELLHVNNQKEVQLLYIQLIDADYTYYNINATIQQLNSNKVSVSIHNMGKAEGDLSVMEALLQEGFPTDKYQMLWNCVQEIYEWEHPCVLQYRGIIQKGMEKKGENVGMIFLGDNEAENYYCFVIDTLNEDNSSNESVFFYYPVEE